MKKFILKLSLLSPTLIGSGEGYGTVIDTDIIYDDIGIPYIPAKRVKGCLLDAAKDTQDLFEIAKIDNFLKINETFGLPGAEGSAPVYFSNLTVTDYKQNRDWLKYFLSKEDYQDIVSKELILNTFTEERQQIAINSDGVALDHSLRTIRLVKKDTAFYGNIFIDSEDEIIVQTLVFACLNLRRLGTKRNRGFGEVYCTLLDESNIEVPFQKKLEESCII